MSNVYEPIVPAVDRALSILEYIGNSTEAVSIKQIATDLYLPKTSAFRIVKQLAVRGYLEEDIYTPGYFGLGFKLLTLSSVIPKINDIRQIAHTDMNNLAVKSKQVVQLGILRDCNVTYIDQILPPNPVVFYSALFNVFPVNISAAGKILTAYAEPATKEYIINQSKFEQQTPNTVCNKKQFSDEVDRIQKIGFALDDEEFAIGIGCLAAPVFNHEMKCIASIGLTGGIESYRGKSKDELIRLLFETCKAISVRLGMPNNDCSTSH